MDTFALITAERRRLADELAELSDADWATPSRCGGWSAHTVGAHLNLPWEVSSARFVLAIVKARGDLDRTMDSESRKLAERLSPAGCVDGLRAHADDRFVPPTMPPEAPLTDVIIHGADILRPLDRAVAISPDALRAMLGFLVGKKAERGFRSRSLEGLRLEATDIGWTWEAPNAIGSVHGPALALASTLVGRVDQLDELTGEGVDRFTG